MSEIDLTICIPTFNRSNYLLKSLTKLYDQINAYNLSENIEVIVSDNASTDNTQDILIPFKKLGLKSFRHQKNIGADKNFLSLFKAASGRYVWVLGDDDGFVDNILGFLLNISKKHNFDYLYLRKTGNVAENYSGLDRVTPDSLLKRTGINITFLSSQVVKRSLIKRHINEAYLHSDGMGYFYVYLNSLYDSSSCLITQNRMLFADTTGNTGGYKFLEVWAKHSNDIFRMSKFGKNKKLASKFKLDIFMYLILPIMYHIKKNNNTKYQFTREENDNAMDKHYGNSFYKLVYKAYKIINWPTILIFHIPLKLIVKLRKALYGVKT